MDKKEKREYLKPYRYFGGYMLVTGIFASILNSTLTSFSLLIYSIIENYELASNLAELISYGAIVYAYYVGYRIFVKKFEIELVEIKKFKVSRGFILEMIGSFVLIRLCWYFYTKILICFNLAESAAQFEQEIFISTLLYSCIIAPIAEEIVFRGFLFKQLRKYNTAVAVFFTSVSFGLFHGTFTQWLPAIFIGLILAVIDLRYDSIIPSVILHIATNTYSMVGAYFNLNNEFGILLPLTALIVLTAVAIIIDFRKIVRNLKDFKTIFFLSYRSAGYILFTVIYLIIIISQIIVYRKYS